jgi:predicted aconitase/predicted aconitase with swiveling domain
MMNFTYQSVIDGDATGELLVSDTSLSFWGGINPANGLIIDQHHPLHNHQVGGKILALPSGRGSSSGSGVVLELLLNNVAPAALIFIEPEDILTLGVLVSDVMFGKSIPVCRISAEDFKQLESGVVARIEHGVLCTSAALSELPPIDVANNEVHEAEQHVHSLDLSESDLQLLNGHDGKAAQLAMQIVVRMAQLQNAEKLVSVTQAHIDACVYNGPSSLLFAQQLASLGGKVKIPTTLNSLSVDKRRWKQQGVNDEFGTPASELGDAYIAMGAKPSYTCAPYLLDGAPKLGQQIVWAESNAVIFANSVIGARTQKYPDFLDACIALTARAPAAGAHLDDERAPSLKVSVINIDKDRIDDAFWPLLGYHIGAVSKNDIPVIFGLEEFTPTLDDLKGFSAAFATTSSVPMYHMIGITPESHNVLSSVQSSIKAIDVDIPDLLTSWKELNSAKDDCVDMICLGNPHFSITECATLASLCINRKKHPCVTMIVTLGRDVYARASADGYIDTLEAFGVQFINDTCWCMIEEPIIPVDTKVLMTNSGKYAHYGPGLVNRPMHFGSLEQCVAAACSAKRAHTLPDWGLPRG